MATEAPIDNSTVEYRYGNGGKGHRGVYLTAELPELYAMLRDAGLTHQRTRKLLKSVGDQIATQNGDVCDAGALEDWEDYVS